MMQAEDGMPAVGASARHLGVRVPADISPDDHGFVVPGDGGMSVAPGSAWNLPNHRRPRRLGRGSTGPNADCVYRIEELSLDGRSLALRPDPKCAAVHAFVEPARRAPLGIYIDNLAATRDDWSEWRP